MIQFVALLGHHDIIMKRYQGRDMCNPGLMAWIGRFYIYFFSYLLLSSTAHASFIEATVGRAVVNDATASYYNPAALVLLKNPQFIPLGTAATFRTQFSGQTTAVPAGTTESGTSTSRSYYYAPSFYLGIPATERISAGLAVLVNNASRNIDDNSILRYVQSGNLIQEYDVVPAIAYKINEFISIGAGLDLAYANLHLRPITGFPQSNIPDSVSKNDCDGTAFGANLGLLIKASARTLIGFNYRSTSTYRLSGTSAVNGSAPVYSNDYHFKLHTPAHSILSVAQMVTPRLGLLATIQYIQWSIIQNISVHNIAISSGIVSASIPYHLRDSWAYTLGSQYLVNSKWVVRFAGTYYQSAGNGNYQIGNGDSIILGASTGYEINEVMSIDGGYAHAFIKNENINIAGDRFLVNGVNKGSRDAVSVKLTFNI